MPRTPEYKIRLASPEDGLEICFLGKKFVKESKNSHLGWDQEKVFDTVLEVLERDDFFVAVMEHEEEIVGMFIAFLAPCFFSDVTQAVEIAWYVLPEHRKTNKNLEMLKMYEDWAKEMGAVQVNMINLDVLNKDKVAKFYKRKGYECVENTFVKRFK